MKHETRRLIRNERLQAFRCLAEVFGITAIQLVTGLVLLVMTSQTLLAVFLVLLSCLSLYFGVIASAYFESVRPRGDRPTRPEDALWASSKLRLCALVVDGGLIVGATALLWSALDSQSDLVVWPAAILCFGGFRAIFMARDYHRVRARELEARE